MITKTIQKTLSVIAAAAFLNIFIAPASMCITPVPKVETGIQKPVLRENNQPSFLKLEGDVSISKANPKISVSLRNSDVKQVLRMFADKAGLNIIFHSSVDTGTSVDSSGPAASSSDGSSTATAVSTPSGPTVTMDLVNVPLNDAFKMVLQVTNLTYYIENNTIIVASADAALKLNLTKQELIAIPIKYIDAGSMATFLNKNVFSINRPGLSNAEIAVTNPNTNEILIFGTKNDFLMAKKVIAQFDKKPLEETFVVNHTTPREMATQICNALLKIPAAGAAAAAAGAPAAGGIGTDLSLGAGTIACQYNNPIKANALASLSTNSLTISYFPQKGTITAVGGSVQQIELIKEFIAKNDKKQPQAYLEVSIIELNESGSKAFNNTWNIASQDFSFNFDGQTSTSPYNPTFFSGNTITTVPATKALVFNPQTGVSAIQEITPATILQKYTGERTIAYTMSYLIKNGKGRVLANPRIMITNGQTSKINLVSDYISKVDATTTTTMATPITTFNYSIASDNGIQIDLTPYISLDGYVTLNIKPKFSTIAEKVQGSGITAGLTVATLLNKRDLDLKNIRIKDGETLTIGGLLQEDEQKSVAKFPVLGDLPGIGMFFRNTSTTKTRNELVIMITPKIIKDSEDIVNNKGTTL